MKHNLIELLEQQSDIERIHFPGDFYTIKRTPMKPKENDTMNHATIHITTLSYTGTKQMVPYSPISLILNYSAND